MIVKIEVLGTGCTTCNTAEAVVKEAVAKSGVDVQVIKVTDRMEISKAGVLITPAVIVDGQVKMEGKIPEMDDVLNWIGEMKE